MVMNRQTWLALLCAAFLSACGGGGGGGTPAADGGKPAANDRSPADTPPQADGFAAYLPAALTGHVVLKTATGEHQILDLASGKLSILPNDPDKPLHTYWEGDVLSGQMVRYTSDASTRQLDHATVFDVASLTPLRTLTMWPDFNRLKLSPDGRYFLSFWHDERLSVFTDEKNPLTVFDAVTGADLKKGSMMDPGIGVTSSPHAWLPDGSYVYMVANKLYKSAPGLRTSTLLAILKLPSNSVLDNGDMIEGNSHLAVSPDGQRIAFSWVEPRGNDMDTNIWVAKLDGSDLHRLTRGKTDSALRYLYGPPAWSPDGKWVLGWLGMAGVTTAPVNPLDWSQGWRVIGWTGCGRSPVFVVGLDERDVEISWPDMNDRHVLRARSADGQSSLLLTSCDLAHWVR